MPTGSTPCGTSCAWPRRCADVRGALWLGVRNFSAPNVPLRSRWGNCLSAAALRLGGVKVQDSQTGLRAIPAALLPLLMRLPGSRYEYETTMLLAARRAGWPLEELEIETVYTDGNRGSHFHPLRDSLRVIGVLLHGISSMAVRFAASSLASAGVDLGLFALLARARLAPCGGWRMAAVALGVRVASAGVNFVLNRTLVFGVHRAVARPAVRYALLCAGQAAASAGLTSILYAVRAMAGRWLQALVDGALFIISFFCSKRWVFRVPAVREEEANI